MLGLFNTKLGVLMLSTEYFTRQLKEKFGDSYRPMLMILPKIEWSYPLGQFSVSGFFVLRDGEFFGDIHIEKGGDVNYLSKNDRYTFVWTYEQHKIGFHSVSALDYTNYFAYSTVLAFRENRQEPEPKYINLWGEIQHKFAFLFKGELGEKFGLSSKLQAGSDGDETHLNFSLRVLSADRTVLVSFGYEFIEELMFPRNVLGAVQTPFYRNPISFDGSTIDFDDVIFYGEEGYSVYLQLRRERIRIPTSFCSLEEILAFEDAIKEKQKEFYSMITVERRSR